jgi:hypothetical protein
VLEVGKSYESPRTGTWVEVVERRDQLVKFDRSYVPNTGRADPHLHEDFTQTWEALSGEGMIEIEDEMPLLRILVIARETDGRSHGASPPVAIQKLSLPLLPAVGRLRGYKPTYEG